MKKVLITGATGTVGESFIKEYYDKYLFYGISRNETKIAELNKSFPKVETFVGDVKDFEWITTIVNKIKPDIIIHAAALKHVDLAEKNQLEAVKVNVIGSHNIIRAALNANVPLTVGISTDKACDPKNVYGYTKKLMEEMFMNAHTPINKFVCARFANVAGSSGSVIPFWKSLISDGKPIKLTHTGMNRLMFSKKESAELIQKAIELTDTHISIPFVLSKKMKSINLHELAKFMSDKEIEIVGLRPGEKLNEKLISAEEIPFTRVLNGYVLIMKEVQPIDTNITEEYSSLSAQFAPMDEIESLITQS